MKRSALAATAVAVLVLSACSGASNAATPSPTVVTPTALPTSTVTASTSPTPVSDGTTTTPGPPDRSAAPRTPRPTPTADNEIPGDLGQVPEGFTLPDEDRPGDAETTAFLTTVWRASCPDRVLTLASASGITATRIKESIGPEHVIGNGLLAFGDEPAAQAFMAELAAQLGGCVAEGPTQDGWRTVQASGVLAGFDDGLQVRQWTQWQDGDAWVEAPGSTLHQLARSGRFVVLTHEGGEHVGDPAGLPAMVAESETRIALMLEQL